MSLSRLAINRPVFTWMLMAALIIFGGIAFSRLGISLLPDVDFPVIGVSFSLPGAAPEVMEAQVLDAVEDAIMEIDGIRNVSSQAQQSSASISIEFELGRDIDQSLVQVKDRIDQVRNLLPAGLLPPRLRKTNPEDQPILWLGLKAMDPKTPLIDLMIYAKDTLEDQFSIVPGVGNVVVGGYVDPALRVWIHSDKMNRLDLTSEDILQAIQKEQLELPAGSIQNQSTEANVRVLGEAQSVRDFKRIRMNSRLSGGVNFQPMTLSQVADIEEGTADIRRISRINGKVGVGIGIVKQHGANAVEVGEAVRAKLKKMQDEGIIPKRFSVDIRNDNTRFIKQSVWQLLFTLGMSALLTSLVCYLFLGSWTSTLNVLMAIPTSIIGTFIAFYFFGFTLNTFTLLGLSLAIGIVVDDAIMMLENIVRHRTQGKKLIDAASSGSEEISFAALAATLAVVAIFIPVVFMKGIIGRYFLQYGVTVTVAVLLSLLESLTLTPMRCSRYLRVTHATRGPSHWVNLAFKKLELGYARALEFLLQHRWKTVLGALALFVASLGVGKFLPAEMMPPQDQAMFMLRFKLPVGTPIEVTNAKVKLVEDYLLTLPEVAGIFSAVGGFGGDAVNQGMAYATLVDRSQRKESQAEIIKRVRKQVKHMIPGMETNVQDLSLRGFSAGRGFPVEFVVQSERGSWLELNDLTKKIMEKLKDSGKVVDVNTDIQNGMPELQIVPNRQKLAEHAVSVSTVTRVINTLMGGMILSGKTEYPKGRHRYQIIVRLISSERDEILDLRKVMVRNNRGQRVAMSELVDMKMGNSLMVISRLNRARAISVYGTPAPGVSQKEAMDYTEKLARGMLPPGVSLRMTGNSQGFKESFQSLFFALLFGIVVSYMVLASQFNSFIHPVTVLMALPFSFSGALIGLALCRQSINMYSFIGFILLMGIVKKNSILLVDYTNQCRAEFAKANATIHATFDGLVERDLKESVRAALIKACPIRLRPIMMTSVATVAGALPEAISVGPGSEAMIPMAIAIIGGVIASTLLTLFVVPCFYSLITRLERPDPITLT